MNIENDLKICKECKHAYKRHFNIIHEKRVFITDPLRANYHDYYCKLESTRHPVDGKDIHPRKHSMVKNPKGECKDYEKIPLLPTIINLCIGLGLIIGIISFMLKIAGVW